MRKACSCIRRNRRIYAQRAREKSLRERYDLPDNFYPTSLSQTEASERAPEPDPGALPGGD